MTAVFRFTLTTIALALVLTACDGQPSAQPSPAPALPGAQPGQQPSLPPIERPTRSPVLPTATASPEARPSASPTPTAIPAATATPAPTATPTSANAAERRYVFPVRSDGTVGYGRSHHDYPAADIFCPIGSEFLAVTDGVVDFVSDTDTWDPRVNDGATRGGLSIAIVGDDGVRYYGSHLSKIAEGIAPGTRVRAGDLLGLTGKSGDARTTDPHLHFGISHPTTPDDWAVRRGEVAPYTYLRAWQRGENVTPELTR
ncbi:MAG: M23 family metallopeptidase [Kouleothrix sp.]|nr:M23 family metallopeptidase [Kouleothrix sp.]